MYITNFRKIYIIILLLFSTAFNQETDSLLYLPALIKEALENNPQLQSSYNAWRSDLSIVLL